MNFKICKNVRRDQLEHLMEERGKTQKVNYTALKNNSVTSSLTRCLSTPSLVQTEPVKIYH